jgi:phage tail-like protein
VPPDYAGGDVLANFTFQIEIDSIVIAQFQKVSGLASEVAIITHQANLPGGKSVMKQIPGHRKPGQIQFEKGKTDDKALWDWHKKIVDGDVVGARKNGSIVLFDAMMAEVGRYNFVNGWPSSVGLSGLDATGNSVLVETCTLVHEGLDPA